MREVVVLGLEVISWAVPLVRKGVWSTWGPAGELWFLSTRMERWVRNLQSLRGWVEPWHFFSGSRSCSAVLCPELPAGCFPPLEEERGRNQGNQGTKARPTWLLGASTYIPEACLGNCGNTTATLNTLHSWIQF